MKIVGTLTNSEFNRSTLKIVGTLTNSGFNGANFENCGNSYKFRI
ncbi:hypothetical protein LEP1GSC072_1954 [Leptospira noguchii str. Bonito]|nr:hypothetical protein LEP1GSC072_1954 [Leptospira noguchii str. Bonito]